MDKISYSKKQEQLELLYNMSISLEFTDPLYWRTVRDLFRESVEIFSILFPSGYEEFKGFYFLFQKQISGF